MATMAGKRDYYEVLGVERSSTDKQIADAYRKQAMKHHPDRNPGDEEAIRVFKECAEAFEVLSDGDKRARYDRFGHAGMDAAPHFNDVNDIFSTFGDLFGDSLFGDFFGPRGGGRRRAQKGADVECEVTLDLLQAARGVTREVEYTRHEACATCSGTGAKPGTKPQKCSYCDGRGQVIQRTGIFQVQTACPSCRGSGQSIKDPCGTCRGTGHTRRKISREVAIPAGVDEGTRLRLNGEGQPGPKGGVPGDCYCHIHVREHPLFHREGPHLLCQVPISYSQAALGATIEVPTLDGREDFEIPAGTQPGDVFKLRGRGMPDPRSRAPGDLVVQVSLDVPKHLTDRQEELLRELAEVEKAHVSSKRKSFFEKLRNYFTADDEDKAAQAED